MADCKPNHTCATAIAIATLLFNFLCLQFVSLSAQPPYTPTDNIVIDCGSPLNSTVLGDDRPWLSDLNSKFFPSNLHHNHISVIRPVHTQSPPVPDAPYQTARLSRSEFTYSFPLSPAQKFIRLYFYSANYSNFQRSKAVFSVTTGAFTLLRNFSASLNVDASNDNKTVLEFCVYVEPNHQKLNLTFTPTDQDSYAFINGIEILSMPSNLYYTPPDQNDQGGRGLKFLAQNNQFIPIENHTSLHMLYRINIGGRSISSADDTGTFRTWSVDNNLVSDPRSAFDARPANLSIQLHYSLIMPSTAPEDVYRTARTMGPNATENKSYNLTWEYLVDPGFIYMVRLHFCEFQPEINDTNDRVFLIHINDIIAEPNADVMRWAGGKGIPIYKDYGVLVSHTNDNKKVNLSVKLQANPDDTQTRFTNVILNGIEIFKLNDSSGNLAGKNPDSPTQPLLPFIPQTKNSSNRKMVAIVISAVVGGVALISALCLFVFCRHKIFSDQTLKDGASSWAPYSISTNKSSQACSSILPSDLCRYFTLSEIKAATNNFDNIFIIGVGRFGNVYKGYINNGVTQVAIRRLKPSSKQGAHEFETEIEMLSQLCHLHIVSLIGYCNDGNEMILVYDYMSHGTLRSHLYGGDKQPLKWKQRLQICIGSARGLHYLHTGNKHTIIHRDVKTTNILLDDKYVAKVFDFKLSKVGQTNMSMAHISTMVKDSFSYLDPEYYRRQQLTEKSDVYSFGVVLCEVLCARPPLNCNTEKNQVYLAEWVRRCYRDNAVGRIVDPNIKSEISPKCLRKFVEIAVSCIEDNGKNRPAMNDVVWGLEFALQLQEASTKKKVDEDDEKDDGDSNGEEESLILFSSSGDRCSVSDTGISSDLTTSNSDDCSYGYNKRMLASVFSELKDPAGR